MTKDRRSFITLYGYSEYSHDARNLMWSKVLSVTFPDQKDVLVPE